MSLILAWVWHGHGHGRAKRDISQPSETKLLELPLRKRILSSCLVDMMGESQVIATHDRSLVIPSSMR